MPTTWLITGNSRGFGRMTAATTATAPRKPELLGQTVVVIGSSAGGNGCGATGAS
jgi:hypothetical protein